MRLRPARPVFLQEPRAVPELWRTPHDRPRRPSLGPRLPTGAGASMGAQSSILAPEQSKPRCGPGWPPRPGKGASRWGRGPALAYAARVSPRPPVAQDRLEWTEHGQVRLALRRPSSDGTTHLLFDPVELLERLAALTPRLRVNLILYHGVLGARAACSLVLQHAGGTRPCAVDLDRSCQSSHGQPEGIRSGPRFAEDR